MFDVYIVTYKNYSIDIIDNYAVISKKTCSAHYQRVVEDNDEMLI